MSRRELIVALCAGVVIVLALASLAWRIERVEQIEEVGFSGAAARNPYLAAEQLFNELGVATRSVRGPIELPPSDHTLVMLTPRRHFGEARSARLLSWVERGGHLVVAPGHQAGVESYDPLISPLGVELAPGPERNAVVELQRESGERVEVLMSTAFSFVGEDGESHPHLSLELGQGLVSLVADGSFLRNREIGNYEHATAAWWLVSAGEARGVWIVYRDELPSLLALTWRQAWTAFVSLGALLLLWSWRAGSRFGPPLPDPPPVRRSLLEHIAASGRFLWRKSHGLLLVESCREAVAREAERRRPGWMRLAPEQQLEALASISGVERERLRDALQADPETRYAGRFTRQIRTLEQVRRSL